MRTTALLKDQFLGLVSHELRTPISTVVGNALLLHKRGHLLTDEDKQQALEDVVSEGQKLQRVIENLLLITRIDAANSPDFRRLALKDMVAAQVDAFSRRRPERRIEAAFDEDAGNVDAEETQLVMVIENLLSNADKYSSIETPIEVTVRRGPAQTVEVVVSDHGIGINPADVKDLFTPFFRTDNARKYSSGMGLGLSVCRRIIESHGGRIWTTPRPEGGTDFAFSLTIAD
jgi:two-component system sensor histidine kinase KdpD